MEVTTLPPNQRLTKNEAACLEGISDGRWHLSNGRGPLSLNTIASLQRKGYVSAERLENGELVVAILDRGRARIDQAKHREKV